MASAQRATSKPRRAGRTLNGRPPTLKRSSSGSFLSGLKSLVVTPFTWLNGGGDKDSLDEEMEEEEENVGAKRTGGFNPDSPARKRMKKTSPNVATSTQHDPPTGYLDPPVLRDSTSASNAGPRSRLDPHPRSINPPVSILTESHRDAPWVFSSVPRAPSLPVASVQDFTAVAPENRAVPPLGSISTPHSFAGGARRPSHLVPNGSNPPLRRQPSSAYHDYSQVPRSFSQHLQVDQAMRSPMEGAFKPQSRSPSVADLRLHQSPIRASSTLRVSATPHRLTILPGNRGSAAPGVGGLYRRSSSMMNLDTGNQALQRQSSSQVMFDPHYGITTQDEVSARDPPALVPRNNAERILLALEQATPLTEARRLRLSQKAALKVPIPSPAAPLKGKAARMVAPYARPSGERIKAKADDPVTGLSTTTNKTSNSFLRYLGKQAKTREAKATEDKVNNNQAGHDKTEQGMQETNDDNAMVEDEPPRDTKASEKPKAGKGRDVKASDTPASQPEKVSTMPGRATSSLRAGRTLTHRTHIPSSRPTNKFSARFEDEDDDEIEEDPTGLTSDELKAWTDRGGGTLEVPAGFSFDKVKVPKVEARPPASEDYKSSVHREADIRTELYKKLRGGAPISQAFFVPSATMPTEMPQVPQQPFMFAGKSLPGLANAVPPKVVNPLVASSVAQSSETKVTLAHDVSKPAPIPSLASAIPSLNFANQKLSVEAIKNPDFTSPTTDAPVKSLPFSFSSVTTAPQASPSPFQFTTSASSTVQSSTSAAPSNNLFQKSSNGLGAITSTSNEVSAPPAISSSAPSRAPAFLFGTPGNPSSMPVPIPSASVASTPEPPTQAQTRSSAPSPSPSPFANIGLGHPTSATVNFSKPADSAAKPSNSLPFSFGSTTASAKPISATQENTNTASQPAYQPFTNSLFGATAPPSNNMAGQAVQEPKPQAPLPTSSLFGNSNQASQPTPNTTTASAAASAPPPLFGSAPATQSTGLFGSSAKPGFSFGMGSNASNTSQQPQSEAPAPSSNASATIPATSTVGTSGGLFGIQTSMKPNSGSPFAFGAASSKSTESTPFSFNTTAPNAAPSSGFGALPSSNAPSSSLLFGVSKPKTPPPHDGDMMEESSPTREVAPPLTSAGPHSTGFSFGKSTGAPGFSFSLQPGTSSPFATSSNNKPTGGFFGNTAAPSSPSAPFGQPIPASPFGSQPNSPFVSPAQSLPTLNSIASLAPPIPAPVFGGAANSFGSAPAQAGNAFSFSTTPSGGVTSPPQANATATTPSAPTFVFGTGSQPSSPTVSSTQPGGRPLARLPRRAGSTARRGASGTR